MTDTPQPPETNPLVWVETGGGRRAQSRKIYNQHDSPLYWRIVEWSDEGSYRVGRSDSALLGDAALLPGMTLAEAQAWCQSRENEPNAKESPHD